MTLAIEQGEFAAIVGTSGSGKSTLLNMMGGLDVPTSGSVQIKGKELASLNDEQLTIFRRRKVARHTVQFVPQSQQAHDFVHEFLVYGIAVQLYGQDDIFIDIQNRDKIVVLEDKIPSDAGDDNP